MINEVQFREFILEQQTPYKVCDLETVCGWPGRKISRHLTLLESEGLIRRKAKWYYETVKPKTDWKE